MLFPEMSALARAAEDAGFDAIFVPDHFGQNRVEGAGHPPTFDAFTLLGALSTQTERVRLGSFVSPIATRNPAVLAKTATTLDVISDGRALFCYGAPWDDEHRGFAITLPDSTEQSERLEDTLRIARAMFTEKEPNVSGKYFSIRGAFNEPRPIQASIPIILGGNEDRRTLFISAEYANAYVVYGAPEILRHEFDALDEYCVALRRDPNEVEKICAVMAPASVNELVDRVGSRFDEGGQGVIVLANPSTDAQTVFSWGKALVGAFG